MALSREAKKAYKKVAKRKNKKKHWLFFEKGDSFKEIVSKFITQIAVVVLIGCVVILGNELRLSISAKMLNGSLKDLYYTYIDHSRGDGSVLESAEELLKINKDTVGWVQIDDTHIALPVVQRETADGNTYYLKVAFDGSNNKAGTIFLDKRCKLEAFDQSDNLIVYGHNQKDRTMFGDLAKYKKDIDFYKEHPTITFASNYNVDTYKIFAYFVTPVEKSQTKDGIIFDYHNYIDFSDKNDYQEFIDMALERTQIDTTVDVKYGDKFLTLSTCSNEFEPSRFVVIARRVRNDESPEVDVENAQINSDAKEPDWDIIYK